ncbi:hypothetical protein [Streptococcus pneumoniae]|uniref:hypothetical protein n=1 Tax=Streptococcus pneumoniae TaxID=1313 RepID=UPI00020A9271|nr:hypothetical protein [Streptococcus pneumoniae]EGJ17062.1 hypothetical protein SPAR120_1108 [Streptococcus pneumoniae GA47901]ELU54430.1 hypothetical protein PCS8203_02187 [Streptococcus pneumoniae PCS8203]ELU54597.1 hypothetical protein PCS8106_02268 [Streptococcus pneumoniae PCS8106]EMQ92431.1 hypothetical protein PCS8235_00849 [Streptococcus pneumoniae PCS8235]MBW8134463.1 hypothetical protein [Streptococcus pneumoniae]
MTLDLDNMTQAEFDEAMAEIQLQSPNIFQLISDFVNKKVTSVEIDDLLNMKRAEQVAYIKNYKARA